MEQKHIDRFRTQLEQQRDQVLTELANHRPSSIPNDDREGRDAEDEALRATTKLVETRIAEDHENLLRKIDFALERLEAGTYQQCAHCGGRIPLERLRAKPSVSLCLSCQQAKDEGRLADA